MNAVVCRDTPSTAEKSEFNTSQAFAKAVADAKELAKQLGDHWQGEVWENLGWHYKARSPCGRVTVYPFLICGKVKEYSAMVHEAGGSGMPTFLGEPGRGKTPMKAYERVVANVKERVAEIQKYVEGL